MPLSIRPMALILGARIKPTSKVPTLSLMPLTLISAFIPGLLVLAIFSRPILTIALFAPVRGTKSAIVAIAASSNLSVTFSDNLGLSFLAISQQRRQATPAPHISVVWTMAYALGSFSGKTWWSVTITSIPNLLAKSTCSVAVTP